MVGAGDLHRAPAAGGIRFAQLGPDTFHAGDPAIFVPQDLHRVVQHVEFDAFRLGVLDFFLSGGHFRFAPAVDHVDVFRPQPFGGPGGIHGHVAGPHHGHVLPYIHRSGHFRELPGPHQVHPGKEFIGGVHPVEGFPRDPHKVRQPGAGTHVHSLEPFFPQKFVESKGAADHYIGHDLHTQYLQLFDFVLDDGFGETEFRDTVHEHPAYLVEGFEQGHVIAHFGQIPGCGQAGRTSAHYSHFDAVLGSQALLHHVRTLFPGPVRHKPFQTADGHRFSLDAQDAVFFALVFLGTHPAAHGRQGVLVLQDVDGAVKILFRQGMDELGNVHVHRAPLHALGILAVQAALGFIHRRVFRIAQGHFLEIMVPYISRLFRHGISHSSTHLQCPPQLYSTASWSLYILERCIRFLKST